MDKNNIIGFLLIAAVLIGFSWYNQPSAEEQRAAFVKDSIEQVNKSQSEKRTRDNKQKNKRFFPILLHFSIRHSLGMSNELY